MLEPALAPLLKKCYNAEYAVIWAQQLSEKVCEILHSRYPEFKIIVQAFMMEKCRYHQGKMATASVAKWSGSTDSFIQLRYLTKTFTLLLNLYFART